MIRKTTSGTKYRLKDRYSKRDEIELTKKQLAIAPSGMNTDELEALKNHPEFIENQRELLIKTFVEELNGKTDKAIIFNDWLDMDNSEANEITDAIEDFIGETSKKK